MKEMTITILNWKHVSDEQVAWHINRAITTARKKGFFNGLVNRYVYNDYENSGVELTLKWK